MGNDNERRNADFLLGRLAGDVQAIKKWLEALSEKSVRERAEDQAERHDFRDEMRKSYKELNERLTLLETAQTTKNSVEMAESKPRDWLVSILTLAIGGAATAALLKFLAKIHWG